MSVHQDHYPLPVEALFSAIRASAFGGEALYPQVGFRFAALYAVLLVAGQVIACIAEGCDRRSTIPRPAGRCILAGWAGGDGSSDGGLYRGSAPLQRGVVRHVEHPWIFARRLGLVTGLVTGLGMAVSPYVEYYADNLPERRMGVFGIGLMFCGFALQSLQYWLAVFRCACELASTPVGLLQAGPGGPAQTRGSAPLRCPMCATKKPSPAVRPGRRSLVCQVPPISSITCWFSSFSSEQVE